MNMLKQLQTRDVWSTALKLTNPLETNIQSSPPRKRAKLEDGFLADKYSVPESNPLEVDAYFAHIESVGDSLLDLWRNK
ncbi:hypothetical protein Btru_041994 [Bulinus truncatus]|nr:hypothetical protein Btru_041994 [Bulinus truncatus]